MAESCRSLTGEVWYMSTLLDSQGTVDGSHRGLFQMIRRLPRYRWQGQRVGRTIAWG